VLLAGFQRGGTGCLGAVLFGNPAPSTARRDREGAMQIGLQESVLVNFARRLADMGNRRHVAKFGRSGLARYGGNEQHDTKQTKHD